ncbi:bacteriochlorophyll 4-vinyl reductase [Pelagibius sp.]|uniref:bacteriochlorophyll 4-vinyl reductase n=1 Tax=Pelagibius sp. TaxID=1931238 RepID=UPI0026272942|nr:bacteriochlorophyll 4-vinyl reductase [Pelagibius sp.]
MAEVLAHNASTMEPIHAESAPAVGPNAVIQLGEALRDRLGDRAARDVFAHAGLGHFLANPPSEMVDEDAVRGLFRSLYHLLPSATAAAIAAEAGRRTADYLLANRIPGLARATLRSLPGRLAAPLLLSAIASNAWTFAGSGTLQTRAGSPSLIEIADNPIAIPGCVWHVAVFKTLFGALVTPDVEVHHPQCCHAGAPSCRFEIAPARRGIRRLTGLLG